MALSSTGDSVNPQNISWTNPTQGTNSAGASVAWAAATDMAGIEISFDGAPTVSVPNLGDVTTYAMAQTAAYQALAAGSHTVAVAVVTKEGAVSPLSGSVTFLIDTVPAAPTAVSVA